MKDIASKCLKDRREDPELPVGGNRLLARNWLRKLSHKAIQIPAKDIFGICITRFQQ
jgi:hypothetical protein